jgi:sugar phosphate permease
MTRWFARFLLLVGMVALGAAGPRAAGSADGLAGLQQSIRQSTATLQGQAAQVQAEQSQQRAESASRGVSACKW